MNERLLNITELFFELIRVAISNAGEVSHTPTAEEWQILYAMAKKQSLLGICFAGVKKLQKKNMCPPRHLYLQWMSTASKIQERNENMNDAVRKAYTLITESGIDCCVMKGQSHGRYYGNLALLRQSGDIDILADKDEMAVLDFARKIETEPLDISYKHVHVKNLVWGSVDLHYRIAMSRNLLLNRKLQKWCNGIKRNGFIYDEERRYKVLPLNDNVIFNMCHVKGHFVFEGVGMRQLMDVYMLLKADIYDCDYIYRNLNAFGMLDFTAGLMWVLAYVFEDNNCLEKIPDWCVVVPNEKHGRFLLEEVLVSGNMGHYDDKLKATGIMRYYKRMLRYVHLINTYPSDFFWLPIGTLYLRIWRYKVKRAGYV